MVIEISGVRAEAQVKFKLNCFQQNPINSP
jgi:hypothetical protein